MPGVSGRNLYLQLDNAAGALQNLSTFLNSIDENEDVGLEDTTTAGPAVKSKTWTPTLSEGGFSLEGPWHATLSAHFAGLKNLTATSSFELGPQGSTATNEKISGECRLKNVKRAGKVNGVLQVVAEFVFDGDVTYGTF